MNSSNTLIIMVQTTRTTVKKRKATSNTSEKTGKSGKTTRTTASRKRSSKSAVESSELTPETIANKIRLAVKKTYGKTLAKREQRITKKVYYACREKLGLDISSQLKPEKLNWGSWNKIFAALFGPVEKPKYTAAEMALTMSILYDTIPTTPSEAIAELIELNRISLEKRAQNNGNGKSGPEFDKLIDKIEDDALEDDEELDDEEDDDKEEDDEDEENDDEELDDDEEDDDFDEEDDDELDDID
jgi:hypothetical protein